MIYLGNAFSLQMVYQMLISVLTGVQLKITSVTKNEVASVDFTSVIGHTDTAAVVADMLQKEVKFNRVNVSLNKGDILYVAQIVGGRLPEGVTSLPEGFEISFLKVEII